MSKKAKHLRKIHQRQARSKPSPTECRICNQVFPTHDTHKAHVRYEHRTTRQQFECYLCKKMLKRRHSLQFHMRQIHCIARSGNYSEFPVQCSHIDKSHLIAAFLAAASQSRDFMCDQCGRAFSTMGQLKNHSRTHVIVDTLAFECDICKRR